MEQTPKQETSLQRCIAYMKTPWFLLVLWLVNLFLVLWMISWMWKLARSMHLGPMWYGQQNEHMMKQWWEMMRWYQQNSRGWRGGKMMNRQQGQYYQNAQDLPMNNQQTPEATSPVDQAKPMQPATTGPTQ